MSFSRTIKTFLFSASAFIIFVMATPKANEIEEANNKQRFEIGGHFSIGLLQPRRRPRGLGDLGDKEMIGFGFPLIYSDCHQLYAKVTNQKKGPDWREKVIRSLFFRSGSFSDNLFVLHQKTGDANKEARKLEAD